MAAPVRIARSWVGDCHASIARQGDGQNRDGFPAAKE